MTEEKSFEKMFPELAKEPDIIKCGAVILQDIQKHCLSKQYVRDAIEKCNKESKDAFQSVIPYMLIEELGLE